MGDTPSPTIDLVPVEIAAGAPEEQATSGMSVMEANGRRFDLARLIGDRIFADPEPLAPATTASTYRQQLQRAFAAELLCPFAALEDLLKCDTSDDACADAAVAFDVSPLAVRGQLENNQPKAN